jgi:prevent-host-death family protein
MISSLRDAKAKLSELVQKAAEGEEVVITVRGEPAARLSPIKRRDAANNDRSEWVEEMAAVAREASVEPEAVTPQAYWDDLRSDRL